MDGALVVVLVLAWALLLLPGALRSRRSSPHATVGGFEQAMSVLRNRPQGREVLVPRDPARIVGHPDDAVGEHRAEIPSDDPSTARIDPVLALRRRILTRLSVSTVVAVLLAVVVGGFLWSVAVVCLAGLGGYVALLRRWKLQREQAREVVRMLRTARRDHEAAAEAPIAHAVGEVSQPLGGWDGLQVATAPNEPWRQGSGVRIRRWEG